MKKIAAMLAVLTLAAGSAMAEGIYGGYPILATNGGNNVYFDTDQATVNADWSGTVITIDLGQTLRIGGQVTTWPSNGGNGYDSAALIYTIDGGSPVSLNLPFSQNVGLNDDQWQQVPTSGNEIGSALSLGLHTVVVSFQAIDGNNGLVSPQNLDNGGSGYSAQINVVPEPSTIALAGLGLFGLIAARRRMAK